MNKKYWWLMLLPIVAYGGYKVIPRGIRNNNPLNIKKTSDQWVGLKQPQTDSEFFQFTEALYGIRAAARIIDNYGRRGITGMGGIIRTWSATDQDAYVNFITKKTGFAEHRMIKREDYPALISAMIQMENGINPYSISTIKQGIALA